MNRNIIFLNGSNLDMSFKDGSKYSVKCELYEKLLNSTKDTEQLQYHSK